MATPASDTSQFEPIHDVKVIERYLKYTIDLKEPIQCLVKETKIRFDAAAKAIKPGTTQITIRSPLALTSQEKLLKDINETTERKVNISFKVQDTLYFIVCSVLSVQEDLIILSAEAPMYKLQRRSALRFKPDAKLKCSASFPTHIFSENLKKLSVFDLSTGGFSIAVPVTGAEWFEEKQSYDIDFSFADQDLKLKVKMANIKPDSNMKNPGWRIGFKFESLPAKLEQGIAKEAYAYTQKIFSKRI